MARSKSKSRRMAPAKHVPGKKKNPPMTPAEQHARFVEAAKRAEADESPNAIDKAFKRLKLTKPVPN